jgi:hypothetical protein
MTKVVKDKSKVQMDSEHYNGITTMDNLDSSVIEEYYHRFTFNPKFVRHAIEALTKMSEIDAESLELLIPKTEMPLILIAGVDECPSIIVAPIGTEFTKKEKSSK